MTMPTITGEAAAKKKSFADFLAFACKGNPEAIRFCHAFVRFCHFLDDAVDRDKPVTSEDAARLGIQLVIECSVNPFYQANKSLLLGLIVQGFNAWVDSDALAASPDARVRVSADVIKGLYHEVVFHTAFLLGGWDHLREVTTGFRDYDFEPENTL